MIELDEIEKVEVYPLDSNKVAMVEKAFGWLKGVFTSSLHGIEYRYSLMSETVKTTDGERELACIRLEVNTTPMNRNQWSETLVFPLKRFSNANKVFIQLQSELSRVLKEKRNSYLLTA